MPANIPLRMLPALKAVCSACSLRELCLPVGLPEEDIARLDAAINRRQRVRAGGHLYRSRDAFHALYAIRSGSAKTYDMSGDGREQIHGFHLTGEILGLDAIATSRHGCNAIALEDCEVCVMPFAQMEALLHELPSLMRQFHRIMSREIGADHGTMMLLGTMSAEEKLAAFLVDLSQRLGARALSPTVMRLPMSREEIGNYLGLKLETVSRTFSRLQDERVVRVERRNLTIINLPALKRLAGCAASQ